MVIEDITIEKIDAFYEVFVELMHEGYGHFPVPLRNYFLKQDYSKKNFILWHERKFRKIILATENSEILGFIVGDNTYGGVGFVSWLGIRKEYRGKGIGSRLLEAYEQYIRSKGAHLLELYTGEESKPFYDRYGMNEIGRREKGYFGQDNIIMNKRLAEWDEKNISLPEGA